MEFNGPIGKHAGSNRQRAWLVGGIIVAGLLALGARGLAQNQVAANYSLIETGLYMGGSVLEPPPGTRAVINLCEKFDRYRRDVSLWTPIADAAPAPSLPWLQHWVKVVHATRQRGLTTYVHCYGGVSRSGLLVVAYCMFEHGWTRDQALDFVRSKRPVTQPNPAFMQLLLEWGRFLQKAR